MPWLRHPTFLLCRGVTARPAELRWRGRSVTLLKPSTYMNLSGKAVRYWLDTLKIDRQQPGLVVVDDIALPFGELRIRPKGECPADTTD